MMKKLNCLGDMCPIPIMRLQKELPAIRRGQAVMLVTDHSCTLRSVMDFCRAHDLKATDEEVLNGVWEITIQDK